MANMSHCRMGNTLADLEDCYFNMENVSSEEEKAARHKLVRLCARIASDFEDIGDDDDD